MLSKEQLWDIRKWHHDHGFLGGAVLWELTKPLQLRHDWTINGHLLGDAVSLLLALKLSKWENNNVVKVRAIASLSFSNANAAATLTPLLSKDTLPPYTVVASLWETCGIETVVDAWSGTRFVDSISTDNDWTDNGWFNFWMFPTPKSHRLNNHSNRMECMLSEDHGETFADVENEYLTSVSTTWALPVSNWDDVFSREGVVKSADVLFPSHLNVNWLSAWDFLTRWLVNYAVMTIGWYYLVSVGYV